LIALTYVYEHTTIFSFDHVELTFVYWT